MKLRKDWEQPDFDIVRAAHAELVVTDLKRAKSFYVELMGLVLTEETADALYLRGYEERDHHSLVLTKGDRAHVGHLAFRVRAPEDVDRIANYYTGLGCAPQIVSSRHELGQGRAVRVVDPLGFPLEYFFEIKRVERLLQRFDLYRGSQIMRIDHFNLDVADVESAYEYYSRLGFRCSEYTATDLPEEAMWAVWMYRKPSVHDVALTSGKGPRLHHLGLWTPDHNSILRTCDIFAAAGLSSAIERGPGRHGISNAFFLYLRDPDGHRIELFNNDYYTGDPDHEPVGWNVHDPQRGTFWGQPAPVKWFEEGSLVGDFKGGTHPLTEPRLSQRPAAVP
jgi:catechol 2,3-dioxygenase